MSRINKGLKPLVVLSKILRLSTIDDIACI
jgi:hypothetical protein